MAIVTTLLFVQYRRVKRETKKIIELKEDYRNHLLAVNKVVQDYNKTKERLEELEQQTGEKKKINNQVVKQQGTQAFPAGSHVYSSDDEENTEDSFVTINRDLEYLKQATLDYIKKQNLKMVLSRLDNSQWSDYRPLTLDKKAKKGRKKRGRSRKVRVEHVLTKDPKATVHTHDARQDMSLIWPIERSNFWISSPFGPRTLRGVHGFHAGIDMAACKGTPVYAARSGIVVEACSRAGYGKTILISHNRKYRTRYAHLDKILVRVGSEVEKGDVIGKVGATGFAIGRRSGTHLHFMVYAFGKPVNPLYFLA
jgi:murein DD-endopeptidase MepM/ murein hydrolase activator NlpD